MIRIMIRFAVLSAFLAAAMSAQADKSSEIDFLMDKSGLTKQVAEIPAQFGEGVRQGVAQGGGPAELGEQIVAAIADGLSPSQFATNLRVAIDRAMSLAELEAVNVWYKTALAEKITALEVEASSAEQSAYVMQNLTSLLGDHERVAMARRVEEVVGGSEMASTMMRSIQVAMINAMMVNQPQEQRQMVLEQIEQQIDMTMPQITQIMLASYVATYSSLSDEELDNYVKFLGTPEAVKFYQVSVAAIGSTIGSALGGLVSALEEE